jgi:hypothetical protein
MTLYDSLYAFFWGLFLDLGSCTIMLQNLAYLLLCNDQFEMPTSLGVTGPNETAKTIGDFWCAIAKISDSRNGVGGGSGLGDSIKGLMTIAKMFL